MDRHWHSSAHCPSERLAASILSGLATPFPPSRTLLRPPFIFPLALFRLWSRLSRKGRGEGGLGMNDDAANRGGEALWRTSGGHCRHPAATLPPRHPLTLSPRYTHSSCRRRRRRPLPPIPMMHFPKFPSPHKNALFPNNRFSTHFFSMKMAELGETS